MKTTLKELNDIKSSLAKLITAQGVPARVCYRDSKFTKKVAKEIETLEEARLVIVKKYAGPADPQGNISVLPENTVRFKDEFDALLKEEVELPDVQVAIGDLENAGLTMLDFANLDFAIVDVDPTEKK